MKPVIVIHGGAGVISRDTAPEKIEQYLLGLRTALKNGFDILENGGSALDATTASVVEFENNPLYNAGRGAVYTSRGTHELDAAIMDGRDRNFGAACTVQHIKHPIKLARKIMEQSPHIFFSGEGAEDFGKKHNLEFVENSRMFFSKPVLKLSRTLTKLTLWSLSNASTKLLPIKPAPPVINILDIIF